MRSNRHHTPEVKSAQACQSLIRKMPLFMDMMLCHAHAGWQHGSLL